VKNNSIPVLTLHKGREKSIYNRHPWIFSGAVRQLPQAENGDIVQVNDAQGNQLGYGFFSPKSQIICRMVAFGTQTLSFDASFWWQKLEKAFALRQQLFDPAQTNAYRLVHAEGDFFPGLIIDIYHHTAVVQLLTKATERLHELLLEGLQRLGIRHIYFKIKENSAWLEEVSIKAGWATAAPTLPIAIVENGHKFEVDVEKGQKTGFFLDQRDNRQLLAQYCQGKRVLNTFCYTGGFSVYALAGGAKEVHSVDISKEAIKGCEQNILQNFGAQAPHEAWAADSFDFLRQHEGYDVVILDPPAFAKSAKTVANATRGYKDLNLSGMKRITPGGILFTFSCSGNISRDLFRKIVFGAAADAQRNVRILHQLTQPTDHPVSIFHPEGEYLKGLVLQIE